MQTKLTITGYSTALFSTWFFIDELALLFDAGDGVSAGLTQKARKIKYAFISHADRDHLGGLVQFNQLNAREGYPIIFYPEHCGSFPNLEQFTNRFDPQSRGTIWTAIKSNEIVPIKKNIEVHTIRNGHIPAEKDIQKSFSFKVHESKRKLKKELLHLSGAEIKALKDTKGEDFIFETIRTNILGYSGDTPIEDTDRWQDCQTLIHEATFIDDESTQVVSHGNKHSKLEEVIRMVSESNIESLVLSHFSSRYDKAFIDDHILQLCKKYKVKIPVRRVPPGEVVKDILNSKIINE